MITIEVSDGYRGGAVQTRVTFYLSGLTLTRSWGSQPASVTATYVRSVVDNDTIRTSGIAAGCAVRLEAPGQTFYGVCMSDVAADSSGGKEWTLNLVDLREFLKWDHVFCAFNMVERVIVTEGGVSQWKRRYWHILPADYPDQRRTYTDDPISAATMIEWLFRAPSVQSPWARNAGAAVATYHIDLDLYPYLNFDALNGMRLDSALTEISNRFGLVFTFDTITNDGYWRLRWTRMGYLNPGETFLDINPDGTLVWPEGADDCRDGVTVSDAPTLVRVLGDRNVWQLLNVEVVKDWLPSWEQFYDPTAFIEYVFRHFRDTNGTLFYLRSDPDDPDKVIARQLALARAQEITVAEFAAQEGATYLDARRYAGRSRGDMPAMLYIETLLFRCFRLPDTIQVGSRSIPSRSLTPIDSTICRVTHSAATGLMTANTAELSEGNGYAVAQGHNLGGDLFERLTPSQFDLEAWTAGQELWQHVTFRLDDCGDGTRVLILDQPMVRSSTLLTTVDGWPVFRAGATLSSPRVRACVTVEADRFIYDSGSGNRVEVISESGLHEEWVFDTLRGVSSVNPVSIPYADGMTADAKADALATTVLQNPWLVRGGGYSRPLGAGDTPANLNGMIDRVQLKWSSQGLVEEVDFTLARGKRYFEPEREYERRQSLLRLFPGQEELRQSARQSRQIAAGMRTTPEFLRQIYRAFYSLGTEQPLSTVRISGSETVLSMGTPLWRAPVVAGATRLESTNAVLPADSTETTACFMGATLRANENSTHQLNVVAAGMMLIRVMGPIAVGDSVGMSVGNDYLVRKSGKLSVGTARQAIAGAEVKLIECNVGGGGKSRAVWQ